MGGKGGQFLPNSTSEYETILRKVPLYVLHGFGGVGS
jgi:hypothetical protein